MLAACDRQSYATSGRIRQKLEPAMDPVGNLNRQWTPSTDDQRRGTLAGTVLRMLIVAPPSETKRPAPAAGAPVDLAALSFLELTPTRERVLEALSATSAHPDAFSRLYVGPTMVAEVARNTRIRDVPTLPAAEVYSGPLHQGLAVATLSPAAREHAERAVVVTSPLWGALRLRDRIPPYRLNLFSRLVGMDRLDGEWRKVLPDVLASAAGPDGLIVDVRSPGSQSIGKPAGQAHRTVTLRISQVGGGRRIGDVIAKRVRGEVARYLLESGVDPGGPDELAALLGERWPVALSGPDRASGSWTLTVMLDD